jgi:hypothetical protein
MTTSGNRTSEEVPPPPAMALFNTTMFDGRCVAFAMHAGGLIVQVRCHCPHSSCSTCNRQPLWAPWPRNLSHRLVGHGSPLHSSVGTPCCICAGARQDGPTERPGGRTGGAAPSTMVLSRHHACHGPLSHLAGAPMAFSGTSEQQHRLGECVHRMERVLSHAHPPDAETPLSPSWTIRPSLGDVFGHVWSPAIAHHPYRPAGECVLLSHTASVPSELLPSFRVPAR